MSKTNVNTAGLVSGFVTLLISGLYAYVTATPLGTPNVIDSDSECICVGIGFLMMCLGVCTIGHSITDAE